MTVTSLAPLVRLSRSASLYAVEAREMHPWLMRHALFSSDANHPILSPLCYRFMLNTYKLEENRTNANRLARALDKGRHPLCSFEPGR